MSRLGEVSVLSMEQKSIERVKEKEEIGKFSKLRNKINLLKLVLMK